LCMMGEVVGGVGGGIVGAICGGGGVTEEISSITNCNHDPIIIPRPQAFAQPANPP